MRGMEGGEWKEDSEGNGRRMVIMRGMEGGREGNGRRMVRGMEEGW